MLTHAPRVSTPRSLPSPCSQAAKANCDCVQPGYTQSPNRTAQIQCGYGTYNNVTSCSTKCPACPARRAPPSSRDPILPGVPVPPFEHPPMSGALNTRLRALAALCLRGCAARAERVVNTARACCGTSVVSSVSTWLCCLSAGRQAGVGPRARLVRLCAARPRAGPSTAPPSVLRPTLARVCRPDASPDTSQVLSQRRVCLG